MSKPLTPNYVPGVGRLTTYRLQLENHINGTEFRQNATTIDLSPNLEGYTTVQEALAALISDFPPTIPSASPTVLGLITLGGDLNGTGSTATSPKVSGLQGRPVQNLAPSTGQVLTWSGSFWGPASGGFIAGTDLSGSSISQTVIGIQNNPVPSPTGSDTVLTWSGSVFSWSPSVTWRNDLSGNGTSTSTNQYVSSLSYSSSAAGGLIAINGTGTSLQFATDNTGPSISQAITSLSPAANFTLSAQSTTGSSGGDLFLSAGGGASESGVISLSIAGGSALLIIGNNGLQYGTSSTPITLASINVALTSQQLQFPYLVFNGTIAGGDIVIDFGSATIGATWIIDTTAVTFGGNTIQLEANGIIGSTMEITNDTSLYQVTCGGVGSLYGVALGPF